MQGLRQSRSCHNYQPAEPWYLLLGSILRSVRDSRRSSCLQEGTSSDYHPERDSSASDYRAYLPYTQKLTEHHPRSHILNHTLGMTIPGNLPPLKEACYNCTRHRYPCDAVEGRGCTPCEWEDRACVPVPQAACSEGAGVRRPPRTYLLPRGVYIRVADDNVDGSRCPRPGPEP